jgi:hypothetical protein
MESFFVELGTFKRMKIFEGVEAADLVFVSVAFTKPMLQRNALWSPLSTVTKDIVLLSTVATLCWESW